VLVVLLVMLATLGSPAGPVGFGRFLGRLAIPAALAAVVVGLAAGRSARSARPWRWWRYFAAVTPLTVLVFVPLTVVQIAGPLVEQTQTQKVDQDRAAKTTTAQSAPTLPAPSTDRDVHGLSAQDLFSPLPGGHAYRSPSRAVERALRTQLGQAGKDKFEDFAMRKVQYAGRDIAVVLVVVFSERATPAFRAGFVRGAEEQSGVTARRVELGGKLVRYMNSDPGVLRTWVTTSS
jgi:hypothetical protein